jgi:catalase
MEGVPEHIKVRQIARYYKADPAYGRGVAEKLGLDIEQISIMATLSLEELFQKSSEEGYTVL